MTNTNHDYFTIPEPKIHYYGFTTSPPNYLQKTNSNTIPLVEQSYIENIFRLNKGKLVTVYASFENKEIGSKVFKGIIEAAGRGFLILSDPVTEDRYMILAVFINYFTFEGEIKYDYPYAPTSNVLGTASPLLNYQ